MKPTRESPELAEAKARGWHNIGEAAALSGVSAKMLRHYESIGLVPPPQRSVANYRLYSDAEVQRLAFIRRSRALGFSIKQIEALLALWNDPARASGEVKNLALAHVPELEHKIRELQAMQRALGHLARHCRGDQRPECPILDDLGSGLSAPAASTQRPRRSRA
jgi:MerR family transcriptional regulator, copper efflux regulator